MIIQIRVKEISFSDVILKAMPVLREKAPKNGSAISKIVSVVTQLPAEVICTMLDAVPQEDQSEIVFLLVRDNQEKLTQTLSLLLRQNDIDVSLDALNLSEKLELSVSTSGLNYAALAAKFLPLIRNSIGLEESPVITALLKLPGKLLIGALDKIPQDKKDEAIAYLINKNQDIIILKIEDMLRKQDIHIQLADLRVKV